MSIFSYQILDKSLVLLYKNHKVVERYTKKAIVNLNKPVKLRFSDGDELVIKIIEQKPKQPLKKESQEFMITTEAPIAKAILGHTSGEEIEYSVEDSLQKVTIVEIL